MRNLSPTQAGVFGGGLAGVFFGVCMGLFTFSDTDRSATSALVGGVTSGLFFGVFMGAWLRYHRQSADRMIGPADGLTHSELRAASRAARGGPVPSDRRVAERATNIALFVHQQSAGWRGRAQTA